MSRQLIELIASETDRLVDAGLYKREVVFTSGGGMAAGGLVASEKPDGGSGKKVINYTTHDYLGLSRDGQVQKAAVDAVEQYGVGPSSQRVMCGTLPIHKELEDAISRFLHLPDALLFGSCYQANIGLFSPLFNERDCIICDELIHPSLADGIHLSGARIVTYRNNNLDDLEDRLRRSHSARFRAIVTNGVFPFSGRLANLDAISSLADEHDALVIVDDCLGIGVLGDVGRGIIEEMGVTGKVDLVTGTFSKALGGGSGGFIAGQQALISWLRQKSPPYMFSAALPPAVTGAALKVLDIIESGHAPLPSLRSNIETVWHGLLERGFRVLGGQHPVLAIEVGGYPRLQHIVNELYRVGIYVHGLTYPVVPEGEARIRMMVSALHSDEYLQHTLSSFEKAAATAPAP